MNALHKYWSNQRLSFFPLYIIFLLVSLFYSENRILVVEEPSAVEFNSAFIKKISERYCVSY